MKRNRIFRKAGALIVKEIARYNRDNKKNQNGDAMNEVRERQAAHL